MVTNWPYCGKETSQLFLFVYSVGKSTLLTLLTGTHSEAASYEFTTLTCIPGIIHYNDTKIQLLDLPGIIEGASEGKGRGRQVIAVSKSSDIVLMVLDASKVQPLMVVP
ncbi:developmentally-regulated G-protein 2-like isoform X2 [Camellia sinensis]|uniref:developmentally-regulated G-protein 2-like isoform X2 n=1 Tax=Camellia sinensis TaxID=4442 RepID=UPI0010356173|nr:developmentally-regulated G-protein 2-like isoform X2 [Camellia sinensis]